MSDFVLYPEDLENMGKILRSFIGDARCVCALLTTKDGQLLSSQGAIDDIDTTSVAALVTGSFAATVTIANLIGEAEFSTMFHRGKNRHIHIALVDPERYLASIFDNGTSVEKVGYYAGKYARELRNLLQVMSGNVAVFPDEDEAEAATAGAVDQVFKKLDDIESDKIEGALLDANRFPGSVPRVAEPKSPPAPAPKDPYLQSKIREAHAIRKRLQSLPH